MYGIKSKTWIISDTHFNHQFMIDKDIRPKNYQQLLIYNWKRVVSKDDTIIHIGDVIMSRPGELRDILKDLPGYKILIMGNHDKNNPKWYKSHGFNEVYQDEYYIYRNRQVILLTHKPSGNKCDINICGHLHDYKNNNTFRHIKDLQVNETTRVYSAELENYKPIQLKDIIPEWHQSHIYFKDTIGFDVIKKKYLWYKLKEKAKSILFYKLF